MIPGSANPLLLKSAAAAGGYQIERSLRFSSNDSAFLSRTPAVAGNRKTWTWAGWVKRSRFGNYEHIFSGTGSSPSYAQFYWSPTEQLVFDNGGSGAITTTQVFRDPSAWYHIVLTFDTTQGPAADRMRMYVNGQQITTFSSSSYPTQNSDGGMNQSSSHNIGKEPNSSSSGFYLADIHFIDGQALTPSSFTEVSATTGQLIPKAYTGSFGTNGFWLKFSDNSAATAATLGNDYSGNNNDWTPNNLSVTAGAGNDSLVDTPTSYGTDTGVGGEVRGNYATWNPLNKGSSLTISNGNLDVSGSSWATVLSTIGLTAGMKSYMEMTVTTNSGGGFGVTINPAAQNSYSEIAGKWWVFNYSANFVIINQTLVGNYSPRVNNGDVLQLAIDYSAGKVFVGINNVWINSTNGTDGNPATGANPTFTITTSQTIFPLFTSDGMAEATNFGQRAFAYTAPSGFKALCDTNLGAPLVAKPNTVMDVVLYTGNTPSSQTITQLNFSPDFVWLKVRSSGDYHQLYDAVRGATKYLHSNTTGAEATDANALTAFTSTGFSVGSTGGVNSGSMVAWTWDAGTSTVTNTQGSITSQVRANASAGFSVVTFNSGGSNGEFSVGHGLGVAPRLIIMKSRTRNGGPWWVHHLSATDTTTKYLQLSTTSAVIDNGGSGSIWGAALPTSTLFGFSVGAGRAHTQNEDIVSYCFAPVAGYSNGFSYTGNGSTDGSFVYLGFRPRLILLKCSSTTGNWTLLDTAREGYNVDNDPLYPNLSDAEGTTDLLDITSNGFKLRSTDTSVNASAGTYIGFAWAENPFQYARAR